MPCDAFKQIAVDDIFGADEFSSLQNHDLEVCWKKSKYLNGVRELLEGEFKSPCRTCEKLDNCRSGCLAQKIIKNGHCENSVDPSCLLLKEMEIVREKNVRN